MSCKLSDVIMTNLSKISKSLLLNNDAFKQSFAAVKVYTSQRHGELFILHSKAQ